MTTGEKIKYLRGQLGLTQVQLAEATGIHLVTIKKYETNKLQPLAAQVEKLAAALHVGCIALYGIDKSGLQIHTVGDFMGLILTLCNIGFLKLVGERDSTKMLIPESAQIRINPALEKYLSISTADGDIDIFNFFLRIKSEVYFLDLLKWERISSLYNQAVEAAGPDPDPFIQAALDDVQLKKELIELELQRSQILLKP